MSTRPNSKGVNAKGRSIRTKSFAGVPRAVMEAEDYIKLPSASKCLLFEFAYQYRGHNNGDLTAAYTILKKRGWRSPTTLSHALKRLLAANLAVCTRQGQFHNPGGVCALYALTWLPIHECKGKHDAVPSSIPLRRF